MPKTESTNLHKDPYFRCCNLPRASPPCKMNYHWMLWIDGVVVFFPRWGPSTPSKYPTLLKETWIHSAKRHGNLILSSQQNNISSHLRFVHIEAALKWSCVRNSTLTSSLPENVAFFTLEMPGLTIIESFPFLVRWMERKKTNYVQFSRTMSLKYVNLLTEFWRTD